MSNPYTSQHSPHNGDSALKDAHDYTSRSIRTSNTGLPFGATSFVGEVNANGDYTKISYYADTVAEVTKIVFSADSASSLNSTYFTFFSGRDKIKYYVWYSVDGNGTNPNIVDSTGIQVNLVENDSAPVVALATRNAILTASIALTATLTTSSIMTLTANSKGSTTDSSADTSGFNVTTMIQGVTDLRAIVELEYDVNCNVIGYSQDVFTE